MANSLALGLTLNKAFLRKDIETESFEQFKNAVATMFANLKPNDEEEEYNKNVVADMLRDSFYPTSKGYMINIRNKTDMAIYDNNRPVVLFEAKNPGRPGMVTEDHLNTKAMHQIIYYYLREAVEKGNTDIRYLVITDCYQWFIFEKQLFYDLFEKKKSFVDRVLKAKSLGEDTDYIYNKHIKPQVEKVKDKISFVHIDLLKYEKKIATVKKSHREFANIYRFLSPEHLLKKFARIDNNKLNQGFYDELLYVMGVKEHVKKNSTLHEIVRISASKRQEFSFLEQVIRKLELQQIDEKEQFDVALNLVLTWVNRLLFLKLLESQLMVFNKNRYDRFMTYEKVKTFRDLSDLFHKVLAVPEEEREPSVKDRFRQVPYLNSSLFEVTDFEKKYVLVDDLNEGAVNIFHSTKLKDANDKKLTGEMPLLKYVFRFFDAYKFHVGEEDEDANEQKTIISASVLGLIFEKINGYKDGAYFTPNFITQYMCKSILQQLVVDKLNDAFGFTCDNYEALKEEINYKDRACRQQANDAINSIKICDPAVGSGHFLVSALNEIIEIKRDLRILQDCTEEHRRIEDYAIRVDNDELVVTDGYGMLFAYDPRKEENKILQRSLFEEKRTIIENCLYGVDLNPNSVEICRLRLWIELLKNAYYIKYDDNDKKLQTLPNIDINIKTGNSLSSAFPVRTGTSIETTINFRESFKEYKQLVISYKQNNTKTLKHTINEKIANIKDRLLRRDPDLFNGSGTQQQWIPRNNLEWMFEFPEVTDEDGQFTGFDMIIGNPPYIGLGKLKDDVKVYAKIKTSNDAGRLIPAYFTLQKSGDIYTLFVERGLSLLKPQGYLSYILPNKWLKVMYGEPLREIFSNMDNQTDHYYLGANLTDLIDFGDCQVFSDATTYTCIIQARREQNQNRLNISNIQNINKGTLDRDVVTSREVFDKNELGKGIWVTSSVKNLKKIKSLKESMSTLAAFVDEEAYRGIVTGLTEAFQIPKQAIEDLNWDEKSRKLLVPYLQGEGLKAFSGARTATCLLCTQKGSTLSGMGIDVKKNKKPTEEKAWEWFCREYPSAAEWLSPFKKGAKARQDQGDYWWELRACSYYEKFEQPKIFYQALQTKPCFILDGNVTYCNNSIWLLSTDNKKLLALLNSRIGWWLISEFCPRIQNGYQLIWDNLSQIPIPRELPEELGVLAESLIKAKEEGEEASFDHQMEELNEAISALYHIE